jgi:peroxiredoxin Q/BCP
MVREACGEAGGFGTLTTSRKDETLLGEGDKLPRVDLLDDEGRHVTTTELLGGPLVLYFYPKDDTPGCTSEASQFRDLYAQFQKKNARIVGDSRDSVESHQGFKKKFSIPFALLADTDSKLCDAFGVIVEKNMYGKKSKGIARSTFLIDGSGKIVKVWPKVNVDEHADDVLAAI